MSTIIYAAVFMLANFYSIAIGSPLIPQEQQQNPEMMPSLLPPGDQHESITDPFQQRWLSVRPFQEYPRPQNEELGLLLQYLDNKRNVPLLNDDSQQTVGGSPLGTMRFGKRAGGSPLGTMRFGKRLSSNSPLGTMRFG